MRVFAVGLLFAFRALSQPPSPTPPKATEIQQQHASDKAGKRDSDQKNSTRPVPPLTGIQSDKAEKVERDPGQNGQEPPPDDGVMKALTGVIAGAAVLQLVIYLFQTHYIKRTLRETEKAASAAVDNARAALYAERAWVLFESLEGLLAHGRVKVAAADADKREIRFTFQNHGKTPAWFTEIGSAFVQSSHEITRIDYSALQWIPYREVLTANEGTHWFTCPRHVEADFEDGGAIFVHLYGIAKYRDISEQPRETYFCLTLYNMNDGTWEWRRSGPPEANRNT